jgi:UrcA family protein
MEFDLMKLRISMITLAAALSFALAAPAAAAPTGERFEARIAYADLDLNSAAGADAMINRLRQAAEQTCGQRMGRMSLGERRRITACSSAFVQKGVVRLENPVVARRYLERGGHLPAVTVASL